MPVYIRYFNYSQKELQDQWIQNNLTSEEKISYQNALQENNQLWASYKSRGLTTLEKIYTTVYVPEVDANIEVLTGEKLFLSAGVSPNQLQIHPNYAQWLSQLPLNIFNTDTEIQT